MKFLLFYVALLVSALPVHAGATGPAWSTRLDGRVKFYQMSELGVFIVGTEKSLYAVDGEGGEILWRRKNARLDETDVAPVSGTDLVLLSFKKGDRTRLEAVDLLSGETVWRTDKVSGAPMQMALDLDRDLLAVVAAKKAKGDPKSGFKRKPIVYAFSLREGDLLWKREAEREVEMMPARWSDGDSDYTLDNYHPPLLLDGRLYLFYEGVVSVDARTGRERISERYRVNEEGLALTEADPVYDERFIYTSGRGRVRAVSRDSGQAQWESQDLGLTPEMLLSGDVLYVRTGGQFTKLDNGETTNRGHYGVSAIDKRTGKTLWRYKGADKGITNILLADESTILLADRDDLIALDSRTGKRASKISHGVNRAAFVLINERGEAVVGGTEEIAAFDTASGRNGWRARHTPPSRGALRIIAAVALRAASLYFRYGGAGLAAYRGARIARAASTLRWSGLARATGPGLTSLASNSAREFATSRFAPFGIAARTNQIANARLNPRADLSVDVEERLMDRIDPASRLEKLSKLLLRRRRLAALRGERMYFYTDLKSGGGKGLAGVNINTGRTDREVRIDELDDRFITNELTGRLFTAKGDRLLAYE